jgi:hypothetical protein
MTAWRAWHPGATEAYRRWRASRAEQLGLSLGSLASFALDDSVGSVALRRDGSVPPVESEPSRLPLPPAAAPSPAAVPLLMRLNPRATWVRVRVRVGLVGVGFGLVGLGLGLGLGLGYPSRAAAHAHAHARRRHRRRPARRTTTTTTTSAAAAAASSSAATARRGRVAARCSSPRGGAGGRRRRGEVAVRAVASPAAVTANQASKGRGRWWFRVDKCFTEYPIIPNDDLCAGRQDVANSNSRFCRLLT